MLECLVKLYEYRTDENILYKAYHNSDRKLVFEDYYIGIYWDILSSE